MMDIAPLVFTDGLKVLLKDTATRLTGTERRPFIAQVVQSLGRGGVVQAKRELGWNQGTVRNIVVCKNTAIPKTLDAFQRRVSQPGAGLLPERRAPVPSRRRGVLP